MREPPRKPFAWETNMSSLQTFLAGATKQAADDLISAFERIPTDKQAWVPMGDARTALDQMAECAVLTDITGQMVESRTWLADVASSYPGEKEKLLKEPGTIGSVLAKGTERMIAAIATVSDEELDRSIPTAFGDMTWSRIISYPYWNMSYHQGQINYIASMLGCLT